MFGSFEKSTGITLTSTVAWLAVAFVFSPAVLAVSGVWGHWSLSLAVTCSALCVALAWVNWTTSSHRYIPSMVVQGVEAK